MSSDTGTGTGFCRVTVAAPDRRIDVALPEDLPLADVYPELLRLSGQTLAEGAPPGFHLVRRDGTVLDSGLPLAAQQIRDGDLLSLRPFAESLPGPVYDDVAEAVAAAVGADRSQWNPQLLRGYGLVGSALLLVLLAFALWVGSPAHDPHSLPGLLSGVTAVLLTALAGARARVYRDRGSALALGLAVTLRARLFRRTPQVLCLLAAGILALVLTAAGASLHLAQHPRSDLPAVALAAAVALGAVVLLTVALVVPDHGVAPAWARILDLVDGLALAALLPLALAVLDVYARVRALTG